METKPPTSSVRPAARHTMAASSADAGSDAASATRRDAAATRDGADESLPAAGGARDDGAPGIVGEPPDAASREDAGRDDDPMQQLADAILRVLRSL